jgi:predicted nucleic-acid-binding Zn-ribbon protein
MANMSYLVAFLKICNHHGNYDCKGCPFKKVLGISGWGDCHDWIIDHVDESAEMIKEYVEKIKAARKRGDYALTCSKCGTLGIYSKYDFEWDGYLKVDGQEEDGAFVFICEHCKAVEYVPDTIELSGEPKKDALSA